MKFLIAKITMARWLSASSYRRLLAGLVILLMLTALLAHPLMGAGWFWAVGNGLGFFSMAGLLYLMMDTRKGSRVKVHQLVSWAVTAAIVMHALWFLIGDPITLEYIQPGAPVFMWSGLLGLLFIVLIVVTALPSLRKQYYNHHSVFKFWHRWLSVVVIGASVYHITASGFYLRYWYQWLLIAVISVICCFSPLLRSRQANRVTSVFVVLLMVVATSLFAVIRNYPQ